MSTWLVQSFPVPGITNPLFTFGVVTAQTEALAKNQVIAEIIRRGYGSRLVTPNEIVLYLWKSRDQPHGKCVLVSG